MLLSGYTSNLGWALCSLGVKKKALEANPLGSAENHLDVFSWFCEYRARRPLSSQDEFYCCCCLFSFKCLSNCFSCLSSELFPGQRWTSGPKGPGDRLCSLTSSRDDEGRPAPSSIPLPTHPTHPINHQSLFFNISFLCGLFFLTFNFILEYS